MSMQLLIPEVVVISTVGGAQLCGTTSTVTQPLCGPARIMSPPNAGCRGSLLERKYSLPIPLHVDQDPASFWRFIERFVERADVRFAVVGDFPVAVRVVHDQAQSRAAAGRRPLEHLKIAVGVAESDGRSATDELLDADRLALFVVDEINHRQFDER